MDPPFTLPFETFWSWLWPLALLTGPLTAIVLVIRDRRRNAQVESEEPE